MAHLFMCAGSPQDIGSVTPAHVAKAASTPIAGAAPATTAAAQVQGITDAQFRKGAKDMGIDVDKLPLGGPAAAKLIAEAGKEGIKVDKNADGAVSAAELRAGMEAYVAKHPDALN